MGKSKKDSFRRIWRTQTELGQTFGVSAVKFGKLLSQHGLRGEDKEPTEHAKTHDFCHFVQPSGASGYWLWHNKNVSEYLVSLGVEKSGISDKEASISTEARKLAKAYKEAQKLDDEGSKLGHMMFCDMIPEIRKIGLDAFNSALQSVGFKGSLLTAESIEQ